MGSPGLAVEIGLTQKTEMVRREGRSGTKPLVVTAVLVTPTPPWGRRLDRRTTTRRADRLGQRRPVAFTLR